MSGVAVEMRKSLAEAGAKRAALQQPDDLKPVYSAAYERTVTARAKVSWPRSGRDRRTTGLAGFGRLSRRPSRDREGQRLEGQDRRSKVRADVTKLLNAMTVQNQRLVQAPGTIPHRR